MRDKPTDLLRGIAACGVVTIHVSDLFFVAGRENYIAVLLRWAVPIFVILFGFYFFKVNSFLSLRKIAFRYARLLAPYLAYSCFYWFLYSRSVDGDTIISVFTREFAGYGWSGQYYFLILFQLLPVLALLVFLGPRKGILFFVFAVGMCSIIFSDYIFNASPVLNKIGDRLFIFWLAYAVFGMFLSLYGDQIELFFREKRRTHATIIFFFVPFALFVNLGASGSPYLFFSVFFVSLAMFFVFRSALKFELSILSSLGRYSLGIFCLNPFFVYFLSKSPSILDMAKGFGVIGLAGVSLAVCICCLVLSKVMDSARLGFLVK